MPSTDRVIVIAETLADGRAWVAAQPVFRFRPVYVTPRSPGAARACTAVAVFATPAARDTRAYLDLLAGSVPSTLTVA